MTSKVIAVFGAGPGLGAGVARRFGREGYRVALVARRQERLYALAADLAEEGIEATTFAADLSEPRKVPDLVNAIRDRLGRIDVVEYAPISTAQQFTPATELGAAALEELLPLLFLTPVELFRTVLPEMLDRKDGALLLALGYTAAEPIPFMSGLGLAAAAARHYVRTLHNELAGTGVYAGALTIASLITDSELAANMPAPDPDAPKPAFPNGVEITTTTGAELADIYWAMTQTRDQAERFVPAALQPSVSG
ncbi:SDR family NAD(P)-dependent oxidoreductase [Actinoplanes sp. CA-131856]